MEVRIYFLLSSFFSLLKLILFFLFESLFFSRVYVSKALRLNYETFLGSHGLTHF